MSPPPVPILSQMNNVYSLSYYFLKFILILSSQTRLSPLSGSSLQIFRLKPCMHLPTFPRVLYAHVYTCECKDWIRQAGWSYFCTQATHQNVQTTVRQKASVSVRQPASCNTDWVFPTISSIRPQPLQNISTDTVHDDIRSKSMPRNFWCWLIAIYYPIGKPQTFDSLAFLHCIWEVPGSIFSIEVTILIDCRFSQSFGKTMIE
jgi:hypothetical protein